MSLRRMVTNDPIRVEELAALVKMLAHEHFSYGEQGMLASAAYKKMDDAVEQGRELIVVGSERDALHDIEAMKRDAHLRTTRLSNVLVIINGPQSVTVREEIERAMVAAYSRGRAAEKSDAMDVLTRLRDRGCPTYLCRDGSRTRDGALLCVYCDGSGDAGHADDCLWPALLKTVGP